VTITKEVLRLAGLLAGVALATSRLGLVAHELVGHGGTALALGAHVTDVRLFWFAGGWIRYDLAEPSTAAALAIAMGGIAVELVCGFALWLAVRRATLGGTIIRGIGGALIVHALWYLATGAWHGYGDGALLYHVLGDARAPFAIAVGLATCAATFATARGVLGALAGTLRDHRVAGLVAAAMLAGGLHAGLSIGELRIRRDATYTETMASERDRRIEDALARWQASHPAQPPDAERARLEREHRTFPFAWLLGAATAAAAIAGARRARQSAWPLDNRLLAVWAATAALSLACVIVIDLAHGP